VTLSPRMKAKAAAHRRSHGEFNTNKPPSPPQKEKKKKKKPPRKEKKKPPPPAPCTARVKSAESRSSSAGDVPGSFGRIRRRPHRRGRRLKPSAFSAHADGTFSNTRPRSQSTIPQNGTPAPVESFRVLQRIVLYRAGVSKRRHYVDERSPGCHPQMSGGGGSSGLDALRRRTDGPKAKDTLPSAM